MMIIIKPFEAFAIKNSAKFYNASHKFNSNLNDLTKHVFSNLKATPIRDSLGNVYDYAYHTIKLNFSMSELQLIHQITQYAVKNLYDYLKSCLKTPDKTALAFAEPIANRNLQSLIAKTSISKEVK